MTLILFPLRSEYTVATHTAVLSLLASMCDGVPRFAGHTSTHTHIGGPAKSWLAESHISQFASFCNSPRCLSLKLLIP